MSILIPSPEAARDFVSLMRRYHGACVEALASEIRQALYDCTGQRDAGENSLHFHYAILYLRGEIDSMLSRGDFICPRGWGFSLSWALSRVKLAVDGFDRPLFVTVKDGRRTVHIRKVETRLNSLSERIDDFEKAVEDRLAARSKATGATTSAGSTEAPAEPIEAPAAPPSNGFAHAVSELRKGGKEKEAALVEHMGDKTEATFRDVAKHVHGGIVSDGAIKSNVHRANRSLEAKGVPLRFKCSLRSRLVFREASAG